MGPNIRVDDVMIMYAHSGTLTGEFVTRHRLIGRFDLWSLLIVLA